VETTGPVLDLKIKFRECLHPSGQDAFQLLEGTQLFEIVVVGTEDNFCFPAGNVVSTGGLK